MSKKYSFLTFFIAILISGCATYDAKYALGVSEPIPSQDNIVEKTIYLVGDAGNAAQGSTTEALTAFQNFIQKKKTQEDYLIFLGDNVYEKGLLPNKNPLSELSEHRLNVQIDAAKEFAGKTIFIPGNHDWYDDGLRSLKRQQQYLNRNLKKNSFQPEDGCPIKKIDVSENIVMIAIDTQWYIADWDKHPTINDECEIKTRNEFFLELEGLLKKNNEKTVLLAMHHPAYTFGPHGGAYSLKQHLFPFGNGIPLPILGSLATQIRSQGGVSPQDVNNERYTELMSRLVTLVKGSDRVILASGHEHSLQYNAVDGVKQIVSGSGSKKSATRLGNGSLFSYGGQGFAALEIMSNGASIVKFYGAENGTSKLLFTQEVHSKQPAYDLSNLDNSFDSEKSVSAYSKEDTDKTDRYRWLWGDHYRYVYGTKLKVPVATLDTLMGGFTIERKGGGHQTRSLRLVDKDGRYFAMRAVKKSAVQFLQSVAFKDNYVEEDFKETLTEKIILDFYTSSHPYASLVVPDLSDAIGVYHTNPKLVFVPKHKALGKYNSEFGDELYVIEERPDDNFLDIASFGAPDAIESSSDVLKKIRADEKYQIDEPALIKARLFDMLLGDWDRHQDQWRWSRFDISDDQKVYRPIPRDRDQVFSNYDGALLDFMKVIIPATRQFQKYSGELKNIKWINVAGIKMDRTFIQKAGKDEWIQQAKFIQSNLTREVIDQSFTRFPSEVQDENSEAIMEKLIQRLAQLDDIAARYYDYLSRLAIITGTDKDDHIAIERLDGRTKVSVSRVKDGKVQAAYKEKTLLSSETNEVWIYGLDDDDQITVSGNGSKPILLRIVGGQNNDQYTIENGRKVKIYDHKSKPNTIVKRGGASFNLADTYSNNTFDFNKYDNQINTILPFIGSNPDDGLKIGITDTYTVKGFKNDPFHRKHALTAAYYFATEGFDISYSGEFANTFGNWNLLINGRFASANFTRNFFGIGNDTPNFDDDLELDFNRVKTGSKGARIGIARDGHHGSRVEISAGIEDIEVDNTAGRFVSQAFQDAPETFDNKLFGTLVLNYSYVGIDNQTTPTRGMLFRFDSGVTSNIDDTKRTFGYVRPKLEFYNAITSNRKLVLRTSAQGQFNLGDSFEFYQAAVLGADSGLRGFRRQRFSGDNALAFGADLRYSLGKFKTGLLPLGLGVFGGYDYGRVWVDNENSNTWHDSIGGGLWINAVDAITGQLGLFSSDDGLRFSFGFGLSL